MRGAGEEVRLAVLGSLSHAASRVHPLKDVVAIACSDFVPVGCRSSSIGKPWSNPVIARLKEPYGSIIRTNHSANSVSVQSESMNKCINPHGLHRITHSF